jgi:mycofactocin precursor
MQTPNQNASVADEAEEHSEESLVEEDLLVEEISIDGMCGVY